MVDQERYLCACGRLTLTRSQRGAMSCYVCDPVDPAVRQLQETLDEVNEGKRPAFTRKDTPVTKYKIRVVHDTGLTGHIAAAYAVTDVGGPLLSIYDNVDDSMPVFVYAPGEWYKVELRPDGLTTAELDRMSEGEQVVDHAGDAWTKREGHWMYSHDKHAMTIVVAPDLVATYGPIRERAHE